MRKGKGKLIYFTEDEWDKIEKQVKYLGGNASEYVRQCVRKNVIIKVEIPNLRELVFELNKIGNNINQIAYKVNKNDNVVSDDLKKLMQEITQVYKLINKELYTKLDEINQR